MKNILCFTVVIVFSLLSVFSQTLNSKNHYSLSFGISNKWTTTANKYDEVGDANTLAIGGIGYFASFGICYNPKASDVDATFGWARLSIEKFSSQIQNWERLPIGNFDAIIYRFDPVVLQGRIKASRFFYEVNIVGITYFTNKSQLLPNSSFYNLSSWYPLEQMEVKNSFGWSLLGGGILFEVSPNILLGIETVLLETDDPKIILKSYSKTVTEDLQPLYGFFPLKFKFSIKI